MVAGVAAGERHQQGCRTIWASERVRVPMRPGNAGGGKDPQASSQGTRQFSREQVCAEGGVFRLRTSACAES